MGLADEGAFSIIVVVDVKLSVEGIVWPRLEVNAFIGCCGSSLMGKQSTFVSTVQKGKKPEGLGVQGQREPGGGRQRAGRECFGPSCAPVLSGVGHLQNLGGSRR